MAERTEQSVKREAPAPRAQTYSIKGGSDVIWGVGETSGLGTVIAFDTDSSAKHEVVENEYGAVTGIVIYDTETTLKLTIVAKATAALPQMGDTLTAGGVSGVVLKAARRAQNKSTVKFEIEAHKWANLSIT